jgi:hypothetical protein
VHGIAAPFYRICGGDALQQIGHRRVGRVQMFGQSQEMKIGAIVENRTAGGDADRTAEIAHQVEQAGCQL